MTERNFDDLLAANKRYARSSPKGFDGIAHQGVMILTCMDSRLEPLDMMGLRVGEAKILRVTGAHLSETALAAMVIGVHKLHVNRILIIPHTHCAAASMTEEEMEAAIEASSGISVTGYNFGVDPDQIGRLKNDVQRVRDYPLIGPFATVGGFLYDVETGLLDHIC